MVAVTAPLVAAGPNALTQSPTARSVAATVCVALSVVELEVVILRVSVLGSVGFFVLVLFELDDLPVGRVKLPGDTLMPDSVTVDPLTAVTLPEAMEIDANSLRKLLEPDPPEGKLGREPLVVPPLARKFPPPRKPKPPPGAPVVPLAVVRPPVHEPVELGEVTVMLRAAMVVFDFFEAVPVTLTQSPAARELTVSETVLENCVVGVQLTVVWPLLAFCTSMVEPLSVATLPVAPMGGPVVAAEAVEAMAVAATSAVAPVPRNFAQRRRVELRLVSVCIWGGSSFFALFMETFNRFGGRRSGRAQRPGWPGTPRTGRQWPVRWRAPPRRRSGWWKSGRR